MNACVCERYIRKRLDSILVIRVRQNDELEYLDGLKVRRHPNVELMLKYVGSKGHVVEAKN